MAAFTQTTHAVFIPEQWNDEMKVALEMNLVLAMVAKHIEHDKKVKGDVIHIPNVSNATAADLSESDSDLAGSVPATEGEFTLTINKAKHVTFYIPKFLGSQLSHYDIRAAYQGKIAYALAKAMDSDLFALWSGFTNIIGTTADGLEGNISDALILGALEKLDAADIMEDGRKLVLPGRQKSKLLAIDKFVRADAVGDRFAKIERAKFGEIYGSTVYFTNNPPTKLAATAPATAVDSYPGFYMTEEAMAIAIPSNVEVDYEYLPQKKAWILSGDCLYGVAEFRDEAGVVILTKKSG